MLRSIIVSREQRVVSSKKPKNKNWGVVGFVSFVALWL